MLGNAACTDRQTPNAGAQHAQALELSELEKYATLSLSLSDQRGPTPRYKEFASFATGAILVPAFENDAPKLTDNGIRVRYSCGATLIAPSYAVTSAHCVAQETLELPEITLEMYRPELSLADNYNKAAELSGTFPDLSHATLTAEDGYHVDRFACDLVARCGDGYGPAIACDPSIAAVADVAVIHCEGRPGDRYGTLQVASNDDVEAIPFVPWKHELYEVPQDPTGDLFLNYTVYPSDLGDNYHYFGEDSEGVASHQLLPLVSIPYPDGSEPQKFGPGPGDVRTDILGCHGTSGSGFLQAAATGSFELLGPARFGNVELGSYLCNHLPSLSAPTGPGLDGISYSGLAATSHIKSQLEPTLADDCLSSPPSLDALFFDHPCQLQPLILDSSGLMLSSRPDTLSYWPYRLPTAMDVSITADEPLDLAGFLAPEPGDHRFGIAVQLEEPCTETPCPSLTVSFDTEPVLSYDFSVDEAAPVLLATPVSLDATLSSISVALDGTESALWIGNVSLVAVTLDNDFDTDASRRLVSLEDVQETPGIFMPGRFVGDGQQGFSARVLGGERVLLPQLALVDDSAVELDFEVSADADLRCGVLRDGTARLALDCSNGNALLELAGDATRLGTPASLRSAGTLFIENQGTEPILLDHLSISSSSLSDSDEDGIPDVSDLCPEGDLPTSDALPRLLAEHELASCLPEPLSTPLSVPHLDPLPGCEIELGEPRLVSVAGHDVDLALPEESALFPFGDHELAWPIAIPNGDSAELVQPVLVNLIKEPSCCSDSQTLLSDDDDLAAVLGETALCLLAEQHPSAVLAGSTGDFLGGSSGGDFLDGGGGSDVIRGDAGNDVLTAGTGKVRLYGGPGDDLIHATHASSATLFGGPGRDEIIASPGDDLIFPGPETRWVLASDGDDQVFVLDACELSSDLVLLGGGGHDVLTLPVALDDAEAAGATIEGFEEVIVDASRYYLSECFGK